jgi:hypothetical protein
MAQKNTILFKFFSLIVSLFFLANAAEAQKSVTQMTRFPIKNVSHLQGVAVDGNYFYAIGNAKITKHKKTDGTFITVWDGEQDSVIRHLNSGVVINNILYCANSNFPANPMISSIEIYDTRTMKHTGSHSFGIFGGSATWIDRHNGFWWVVFANYNGKHSSEGRDNHWTTLVKFNDSWSALESWVFPESVLQAFAPNSNSGGNWGRNELLYLTGHDKKELYIMKLPSSGYTLELVALVAIINPGQAIAMDRSVKDKDIFYAVDRQDNSVVVEQIK